MLFVDCAALRRLGVKGVEIRKPEQLQNVSSLIIPGGESTTMAKLAEYHKLVNLSLFGVIFFGLMYYLRVHLLIYFNIRGRTYFVLLCLDEDKG